MTAGSPRPGSEVEYATTPPRPATPWWVWWCVSVSGTMLVLMLISLLSRRDPLPAGPSYRTPPPNLSRSAEFEKVQVGMTVEQAEQITGPGEKVRHLDGTDRVQRKHLVPGRTLVDFVTVEDGKVSKKHSVMW